MQTFSVILKTWENNNKKKQKLNFTFFAYYNLEQIRIIMYFKYENRR